MEEEAKSGGAHEKTHKILWRTFIGLNGLPSYHVREGKKVQNDKISVRAMKFFGHILVPGPDPATQKQGKDKKVAGKHKIPGYFLRKSLITK
jgi:hypothetical protein